MPGYNIQPTQHIAILCLLTRQHSMECLNRQPVVLQTCRSARATSPLCHVEAQMGMGCPNLPCYLSLADRTVISATCRVALILCCEKDKSYIDQVTDGTCMAWRQSRSVSGRGPGAARNGAPGVELEEPTNSQGKWRPPTMHHTLGIPKEFHRCLTEILVDGAEHCRRFVEIGVHQHPKALYLE